MAHALLLAGLGLYALFPVYWAVVSSLRTGSALFEVSLWPRTPAWQNYAMALATPSFGRSIVNSALVAGAVAALSLVLGLTAAYALGRLEFRGRKALLFAVLGVSMFPQIAVLSGMFELVRALGLYNRLPALVLADLILTLPFTVWVLTSFMRELPAELEEAALVDGAPPRVIAFRIFWPLVGPGLAATGLLAFIAAWNELLFGLTFAQSDHVRTVPVAMTLFSGGSAFESPWGVIMAAAVIVTAPIIGLVLVAQRWIVSGLTAGAVKG